MIAAISPADYNHDETHSTLQCVRGARGASWGWSWWVGQMASSPSAPSVRSPSHRYANRAKNIKNATHRNEVRCGTASRGGRMRGSSLTPRGSGRQ